MDTTVNIQSISPNIFQPQDYSISDTSNIASYEEQNIVFDPTEDYIEYYIFNLNKDILYSNISAWPGYSLLNNIVNIDPQKDLESQGYEQGTYYTLYNFLKRKLSSSSTKTFFIQEISGDRTEIRLNTNQINISEVASLTQEFSSQIKSNPGSYLDFYLNFGANQLVIANNILLDDSNPANPTVLIKLYEALPQQFSVNSQCWVVEKTSEPLAYQIDMSIVIDENILLDYISGPNFNLDIKDQVNNSTPYYNQNSLLQNYSLLGSGSLLYQINSLLVEKGIEINVDYSDYSNFIHFSSAETRLENFYYKLSLIEQYIYNAGFSSNTPTNYYVSSSQTIWQNKINEIITGFDGYEYFLYYESGSNSWPKTNSVYPYTNALTTSTQGLTWYNAQNTVALAYDSNNPNGVIYTIPTYLFEDPNNDQYKLFVQMIGQHFDNIWLYLKDITNKFDADNRLNYGISKDIVAQAIRDLGVKIYQNNFSSNDLYSSLLGITPTGDLFNIPYSTGSLPTPTGYEYINTFVTASATGSLEPVDDINKEIYKRIYHNLPMLLKKKGTAEGLRMLVNVYGIPDTILRINEFGGKSYENQAWDNFADQFNYALSTSSSINPGSNPVTLGTSFDLLGPTSELPTNFQFRFKTLGIPNSTSYQLLFQALDSNSDGIIITLEYTGSGYNSGSYSGSIVDPYNTYGTLTLWDESSPNTSCSIYLPFYDGGWWSVMMNADGSTWNIYTQNKIYNGYDGSNIGFQGSSSMSATDLSTLTFPGALGLSVNSPFTPNGSAISYNPFTGSYQELRIYSGPPLSKLVFNDYTMNPYSIEGNSLTTYSSFNTLYFRAPLGTDLDNHIDINQGADNFTLKTSIHPSITQYPVTQSFSSGNSTYYISGKGINFEPNTEVIYQNQFVAGIKNSVSEKIRIVDMVLPPGNTLSQYISIQQNSPANETFTKDVNYVEAAFSPQDEVNDDIISQLGFFNIGSYIGDPRQLISGSSNYYPDFNKLRDYYFSKYTHNYDLNDYIRLIKFFDNSLFKMIKDFTPARAGLASGIVIKPTLLERYRYPQPKVNTQSTIAFVGSPTSKTINIQY